MTLAMRIETGVNAKLCASGMANTIAPATSVTTPWKTSGFE
jgi:hypothetical protein